VSVNIAVDTAKTFSVLIYMGSEPRADFNTGEHQRNAAGTLKWSVTVAAQTIPANGQRSTAETLSVGIASDKDPGAEIQPGTPILLDDLRAGVMDPEQRGEKIRGGRLFWQATGVRPLIPARPSSS
jgi:hypothetical protein